MARSRVSWGRGEGSWGFRAEEATGTQRGRARVQHDRQQALVPSVLAIAAALGDGRKAYMDWDGSSRAGQGKGELQRTSSLPASQFSQSYGHGVRSTLSTHLHLHDEGPGGHAALQTARIDSSRVALVRNPSSPSTVAGLVLAWGRVRWIHTGFTYAWTTQAHMAEGGGGICTRRKGGSAPTHEGTSNSAPIFVYPTQSCYSRWSIAVLQ